MARSQRPYTERHGGRIRTERRVGRMMTGNGDLTLNLGRWLPAAPQWHSLHGTYEDLVAQAESWPITHATPGPVAEMLATARRLFSRTWFAYDFGLAAVIWSLTTLEAALRHLLGALDPNDSRGLGKLIDQISHAGVLDEEWTQRLDAARQLRNRISHGHIHGVWSPGILDEILRAIHQLVAHLFPDRLNQGASNS